MHSVLTKRLARERAPWRVFVSAVLALMAAFSLGCGQSGPISNSRAEGQADYLRAKKLSEDHDFQTAAEFYSKALEVDPDFADAHLDLGLLCDGKLGDPISAIYHYRRYLELQPDSEKKQLVLDFIERAKLSLASKLPQSPIVDPRDLTRLQNENAALLQENAHLRSQLTELEKAAHATKSAAAASTMGTDSAIISVSAPVTTDSSATVTPTMTTELPTNTTAETAESSRPRVHVVQKGDTLFALALRYYGTGAAWDRIYQANRSDLSNRDQLRVGQQLVIP